jgi:hypothetical protein|tara:strand:- start:298 stop:474 length:177 start_codon:yes stop_codon:yes gene_type:complete
MVKITKDNHIKLASVLLEELGWKAGDELLITKDSKSITLELSEMDLGQYRELIRKASD